MKLSLAIKLSVILRFLGALRGIAQIEPELMEVTIPMCLQDTLNRYDQERQTELQNLLNQLAQHVVEQLYGENHVRNCGQVMGNLLEIFDGGSPREAFERFCGDHLLVGEVVNGWQGETQLGRVVGQEGYSRTLLENRVLPDISSVAEYEAFFDDLQRLGLSEQCRRLASVPLGFRVIWATFDYADRSKDPFLREDYDPDTICNNLGLGHLDQQRTLMAFVYSLPPEMFPRFPTVFDNRGYKHWKPSEAGAPHAWTIPTPGGVSRPEVVHGKVNGDCLKQPFRILPRQRSAVT